MRGGLSSKTGVTWRMTASFLELDLACPGQNVVACPASDPQCSVMFVPDLAAELEAAFDSSLYLRKGVVVKVAQATSFEVKPYSEANVARSKRAVAGTAGFESTTTSRYTHWSPDVGA